MLLVHKGNPKHISNWPDLARSGVEQKTHFDDGGVFDKIYVPGSK